MAGLQRPVRAQINDDVAGHWRVVARGANGAYLDITIFRGAPTVVGEFGFTDPFGATTMSINFPQVSIFDAIGTGDLKWVFRHVDVDVIWQGYLPPDYPFGYWDGDTWVPKWAWEGYLASISWESGSMNIQLKGALLQLDNFLAKPEYAGRPMPYEWAIYRQFLNKPSLRVAPLKIIWPSWWTKTYQPPAPGTPSYLIPAGVSAGQQWTAMTTRDTGSWDPVLTSYIQTMLASMYTERGRWSIELQAGRQPELLHRDFVAVPDSSTVVIDPTTGVKITLTEDWEQSLTTVYGQGTSLAGVAYSGMDVSGDGSLTRYTPLASSRQVWPVDDNPWMVAEVMAKEVMLQMQTGLSPAEAAIVARAHLARFADPGVTGTIVLDSDPMMGGVPIPRHLVRAGMDAYVPGLFGRPEGVLVHISASTHSLSSGSTTLTVDSKRRDALTVEEVRTRGRDSLAISRMLIGGQYEPLIPDQLFPWSYAEGSGYLPKKALDMFEGIPNEVAFPWTEWTTRHPPSDPAYKDSYLGLGPVSAIADKNWITASSVHGSAMGIPVRMAQAGTVRMLQIAAYNKDGSIAKVPFHVSFYAVGSVNVNSMPAIPADQVALHPYPAAQHYPFVRDGFESTRIDGTKNDPQVPQPVESVGLLKAYGTYYEKAGHWPGSYATGSEATGLLVDESTWSFDVTGVSGAYFDPYQAESNLTNTRAGQIYAMIYCDARAAGQSEVFFLGRIFRAEPTAKGA
jgi:hypothetical protein